MFECYVWGRIFPAKTALAVFYRYHGHHRLDIKFAVFTDSSNKTSIEIEVSIVMQLNQGIVPLDWTFVSKQLSRVA